MKRQGGGYGSAKRGRYKTPKKRGYRLARKRNISRQLATARYGLGIKNVGTAGILGMETQYCDFYSGFQNINSPVDATTGRIDPTSSSGGATPGSFVGVWQGDGPYQRTGMKISLKSIELEFTISTLQKLAVANPLNSPSFFVALVLDTQTNGAAATSELVYQNPSSNNTAACNPLRNMSYTERFKVLKKMQISWPPISNTQNGAGNYSVSGDQRTFRMFKKLRGLQVKYLSGSTTGQITQVVDNSIFLIAYTTDTTTTPNICFNARIRFYG